MKKSFLAALLRNPKQMGAILPSSDQLANAMASQVLSSEEETVLELGPGTGVVTKALLSNNIKMKQLLLVEKDPDLAEHLMQKFASSHAATHVISGDAAYLKKLVHLQGVKEVGTVVSSLPLMSLNSFTRIRIINQIFSILKPNGKLVQFTYATGNPIPKALTERLSLEGVKIKRIYGNIPPASVWVYTQRPVVGLQETAVLG